MSRPFFIVVYFFVFRGGDALSQPLSPDSVFSPATFRSMVEYLASDSLKGRLTGSEECTKAAQFIAGEFEKAGLKPVAGLDGYFMPVTGSWSNVVGAISGKTKKNEIIVFSAHYDHIGTISTGPRRFNQFNPDTKKADTIYNGANDNASGVSALIALARYFVMKNINERTIFFVAFAGEEQGVLGSSYFVRFIEPALVISVINIEMIGRKQKKSGQPFLTGAKRSDLIKILNRNLFQEDSKNYKRKFFKPESLMNEKLFVMSDNLPFAELGIPAHTVMATDTNDPHYHSFSDEASTLDYELMSRIVRAIALSSHGLIAGKDTPSRIVSNFPLRIH